MARENVELVRRGFAALAERGVEGVIPLYTEDAVIYSIPELPDDPEYHRHEGLRKLIGQWNQNFDEFNIVLVELRDAGDAVVARFELTGRIKGSMDRIARRSSLQSSLISETDRSVKQRLCSTWQAALEAAGLRE